LSNLFSLSKFLVPIITTLIWNSVVDNFFKILLDVKFKLSIFTHWILFIIVGLLPLVILIFREIEFNRVVSSSD
jgi:hypothetical protein